MVTWGRDFGLQVAHADGLGFWAHVGRILGGIWGCRLLTLMDSGFGWDLSRTLGFLIFQVGFGLQVARSDGAGRCWVEVWGCGLLALMDLGAVGWDLGLGKLQLAYADGIEQSGQCCKEPTGDGLG